MRRGKRPLKYGDKSAASTLGRTIRTPLDRDRPLRSVRFPASDAKPESSDTEIRSAAGQAGHQQRQHVPQIVGPAGIARLDLDGPPSDLHGAQAAPDGVAGHPAPRVGQRQAASLPSRQPQIGGAECSQRLESRRASCPVHGGILAVHEPGGVPGEKVVGSEGDQVLRGGAALRRGEEGPPCCPPIQPAKTTGSDGLRSRFHPGKGVALRNIARAWPCANDGKRAIPERLPAERLRACVLVITNQSWRAGIGRVYNDDMHQRRMS